MGRFRSYLSALIATFAIASAVPARAQVPATGSVPERPRARVAIEETLAAPLPFLTEVRPADAVPLAARIAVSLEALRDPATLDGIDARATTLLARDVSLWVAVESPTPAAADLDAWSTTVNALIGRLRTRLAWL